MFLFWLLFAIANAQKLTIFPNYINTLAYSYVQVECSSSYPIRWWVKTSENENTPKNWWNADYIPINSREVQIQEKRNQTTNVWTSTITFLVTLQTNTPYCQIRYLYNNNNQYRTLTQSISISIHGPRVYPATQHVNSYSWVNFQCVQFAKEIFWQYQGITNKPIISTWNHSTYWESNLKVYILPEFINPSVSCCMFNKNRVSDVTCYQALMFVQNTPSSRVNVQSSYVLNTNSVQTTFTTFVKPSPSPGK